MTLDVSLDVRIAISDVVIRYATAIDTRDWRLFRSCFTEDCIADYGSIGAWEGLDAFAKFMEDIHAQCGYSLHRISNQVVSRTGDRPLMRSYVDALVLASDNASGARSTGWYDDDFVWAEGSWRIAKRRFTMVHVTSDIGRSLRATGKDT